MTEEEEEEESRRQHQQQELHRQKEQEQQRVRRQKDGEKGDNNDDTAAAAADSTDNNDVRNKQSTDHKKKKYASKEATKKKDNWLLSSLLRYDKSSVRRAVTPYLPPPVVRAVTNTIDPALRPYVGPEATVTCAETLFFAWLIWILVKSLHTLTRGKGRAIADDDDEDEVLKRSAVQEAMMDQHYDATVLLCGPTEAGKTRLFYQLAYGERNVGTVQSIRANLAVSAPPPPQPKKNGNNTKKKGGDVDDGAEEEKEEENTKDYDEGNKGEDEKKMAAVRFMDWPGHASLDDPILEPIFLQERRPLRVVLVLDSTLAVTPAADTLDQVLTHAAKRKQQATKSGRVVVDDDPLHVFVACHKKDFPKAKNWRRIKIQLRTELERLVQVQLLQKNKAEEDEGEPREQEQVYWWSALQSNKINTKQLSLDNLGDFVRLHFASTTCEGGRLSEELTDFCWTGADK